jgi:fibronectin-binding autotransporter adhesin
MFPVLAGAQTDNLWTGTVSNDWLTTGNWSLSQVPNLSFNAIVNGDASTLAILEGGTIQGPAILRIGTTGQGEVVIRGGGALTTGFSGIGGLGEQAGSVGLLTVTGSGSALRFNRTLGSTHNFFIGDRGQGALNLVDGGALRLQGNSAALRTLTLANQAGSTGVLNIGNGGNAGLVTCFTTATAACAGVNRATIHGGAGSARLNFNHSEEQYLFAADITGSIGVHQIGSGKTVLTGSSYTYTGGTAVEAGTLTFSSSSTLVGNVSVQSGGTLATNADMSGDPRGPSTLTIGGNLTLAAGANVHFGLGQFSDDPTTSVGDRIVVQGDLQLGGSLTVADIGNFGNGVYTLFEYGGGVSGAMDVGLLPGDFAGSIRLDFDNNRVLLEVGASLGDIVYWTGGDGVWDTTEVNWSDFDGTVTGSWNDAFAVFRTTETVAAGTVTVEEPVNFTGLQFMNNGFVIDAEESGQLVATEVQTTLRADADVTGIIAADIAGSGGILKDGTGTVVLAGNNSWSGNTVVLQGTLQLGDGGESGNLPGNVNNGGVISFNRSNEYVYGGVISGSGSVRQDGEGTTILTANQTYTGQTTVSNGTLQIGNGGMAGRLASTNIQIGGDGTLAFNRSDDITVSATIGGSGQLEQRGAGLLTLSGNLGNFSGSLLATAGRLDVTGTFGGSIEALGISDLRIRNAVGGSIDTDANLWVDTGAVVTGAVSVREGGRLRGTGQLGETRIFSGATLAPGNSIGRLTINGNLTLDAGSTFEVEVDSVGNNDSVLVNGQAILNGGSVLVIEADNPNAIWQASNPYTIITTTGGVSGEFGDIQNSLAFLDAFMEYGSDTVTLVLERNDVRFGELSGLSQNQSSVGDALEDVAGSDIQHPIITAMLSASESGAKAALSALSGEAHASARSMLLDDSRLLRDTVMGRSFASAGRGLGTQLWMQALGHQGATEGDGVSKFERDAVGLLIGADHEMSNAAFSMGWAAGYHMGSADSKVLRSSSDLNNVHIAAYGGMRQAGGLGVRLGVGHTWHEVDAKRTVAFPGFEESLKSDYDGTTLQAFGEVDYRMAMGKAEVAPFLGLTWAQLDTDGFEEADFQTPIGSTAALPASSQSSDASFATLGARGVLPLGPASRLQGMLGYRRTLSGDDPTMEFSFLDGNQRFDVVGTPIARDALIADLGFDFALGENVRLGAAYNGQLASDARDHAIQARLVLTLE